MRPLEQATAEDGHVDADLGLYLVGVLSEAEELQVEAHMLRCRQCRAKGDELSRIPSMLSMLPVDRVEALNGNGSPRSTLGHQGMQQGGMPTPEQSFPAQAPTMPQPAQPSAPQPVAYGRRQAVARRRPRQPRRALVYAVVLVLGALIGVGGWSWLGLTPFGGAPVDNQVQDSGKGSLTVTLSDRAAGGVDVRAVVVGLRPGIGFELLAVGADDRNYVVVRGVAAGGPQTIAGKVPIAASQIRFFTIAQGDGHVLLLVSVP
jgi:anti-sigma factor RsiW